MVDTNVIKSEFNTLKKQNTYINKLLDKEIKKLEEFKPNAKIKQYTSTKYIIFYNKQNK